MNSTWILFANFIAWYWKKLKHNNQPYSVDDIAADSGMSTQAINAYLAYCQSKGDLTDDQLIALDPIIVPDNLGFGLSIKDRPAPIPVDQAGGKLVVQLTADELGNVIAAKVVAAIKQ